ncbi:MAG: ATP synthase F0 subunit B [Clostridiales bacterium]|jgi:F-type H+-transporting ATPase subunit b|nr:ATP synthase F0 subunit B [Clostridiales bacterium]
MVFLTSAVSSEDYVLRVDETLITGVITQWVLISILILILVRLLYKPVLQFLQMRADRLRREAESAARDREEAESLRIKYNAEIERINSESAILLDDARQRAAKTQNALILDANKKAAEIRDKAKSEIDKEKAAVAGEVRTQTIQVASLIAGRYVKVDPKEVAQSKLLRELGGAK